MNCERRRERRGDLNTEKVNTEQNYKVEDALAPMPRVN